MAAVPIIPFALWLSGTNQNSIPANDNALRHEVLNGLVISKTTTAQPASPTDGDIYIIPAGATGTQWSLLDADDLAIFKGGSWYAFAPVPGVVVNFDGSQEQFAVGSPGGWTPLSGGGGGGATWGSITGTLSDQTDLQGALDAKASITYVDGLVQGLSWKKAVRAATTANGTLATAYENGDAIDGVTLATGDRILIKDQTTGGENGIYTVNASGAPTRATDADTGAELVNATVYVSDGTTLADTQWTQTANAPITIGSTSLAFAQLSAGGGGGLTGFTSSLNTSAPNSGVNVSQLLASGGSTNQNVALTPAGSGGLMAQVPDNTAAGGNNRGANCVDWQTSRSLAAQVASAANSAIGGGIGNTANGTYTNVTGGRLNTATGQHSTVTGGWLNAVTGTESIITGGRDNASSGTNCRVGGASGSDRGITAADVFGLAAGFQRGHYHLQRNTTNATTATATAVYNAAASASNTLTLNNNSAVQFSGMVVAKQLSSTDAKCWKFEGLIVRGASAGTTILTAAVTSTVVAAATGAAAWTVAVSADTTLGGLKVEVTGEAAKNIAWNVVIDTSEVSA